MKFLIAMVLTFTAYIPIALSGITTNDQGDVTFDNGAVVTSDEVVTAERDSIYALEIFCDIGVEFSFRGNFNSDRGAQDFCRGFNDFCRTRRFSDRFHEANYRRRVVFRGRGNDHQRGRSTAFGLYLDFINQGNFHNQRFSHQFFFSDNCSR